MIFNNKHYLFLGPRINENLKIHGWNKRLIYDFMVLFSESLFFFFKKALIADAKKAFTSKLPNSIRQSLIVRLKLLSLGKSLPEKED